MATQLGYRAYDPNNPNNQPYDFGNLSGGMPDINSQLSTTIRSISQPVGGFTPTRLDSDPIAEGGFGGSMYGGVQDFIPTGPGSANYETKLRNQMEVQEQLREELAPKKKNKGYTLLKKGTAKVPGKGDGTKDTVPAKLAPGEAVLNKAAAEHLGRGLIKMLNQYGMHKMGMVEPDQEGYFKCGTEEVMKRRPY